MIRIDRLVPDFQAALAIGRFAITPIFRVRPAADKSNRFLVGDVDGRLQRVEGAAFYGKARRATIAAVADIARVAAFARGLQRGDRVAFFQDCFRTAVQMHKIDTVGLQPAQTAFDAFQDRIARPVSALRPRAGVRIS